MIRGSASRPNNGPMAPIYARARDGERLVRRVAVGCLAVFAALLACRPASPPPESLPKPAAVTPTAAERPVDRLMAIEPPKVIVPPVETEELLPAKERRPASTETADGPLILRVGLATDLDRVTLPCCDPRIEVQAGATTLPLGSPITIRAADGVAGTQSYRLQVAALKDEQQAHGAAERLSEATGEPAEAVFDADTDLYRVRLGRFPDRATAETFRQQHSTLAEAWVVTEGGDLEAAALIVRQGSREIEVTGRWLEVRAPEDVGIPWGRTRYRGALLIFLNGRGGLNVVNEIDLEAYLRGVVPKEMGPELYNRIEAIKAQTVAARTYTLRHLGEFADEGYDICSTPRCQVYGGMAEEHPVSDRAIRETEGQVVLFDGEPAQTFYSATCGGHTENVEVVFPLKSGDYLKGVPCPEAGATHLRGNLELTGPFPSGLARHLLPTTGGDPVHDLGARLEHLALLAGLSIPADQLDSLERRGVLRYIGSVYDVVLDRRVIAGGERLNALLDEVPEAWRRRDFRLATFLRSSRYFDQPETRLTARDADELLVELALYLGVLGEERGHFLETRDGQLRIRRGIEHIDRPLGSDFATFRNRDGQLVAATLDLMAGDRVWLYWYRERLVAVVQPVDAPPIDFSRRAPKQQWTVFKSDRDLRQAVQQRYPGFPFERFEILERGVSGRVGRLALVGTDGQRIVVEGLAVRWTLDVWDTLFWAQRDPRRGGWVFRGRGWGHGVGMSQAGAFGMAVRGATYREILEHYYTGVRLGRLEPAPPRPRAPS